MSFVNSSSNNNQPRATISTSTTTPMLYPYWRNMTGQLIRCIPDKSTIGQETEVFEYTIECDGNGNRPGSNNNNGSLIMSLKNKSNKNGNNNGNPDDENTRFQCELRDKEVTCFCTRRDGLGRRPVQNGILDETGIKFNGGDQWRPDFEFAKAEEAKRAKEEEEVRKRRLQQIQQQAQQLNQQSGVIVNPSQQCDCPALQHQLQLFKSRNDECDKQISQLNAQIVALNDTLKRSNAAATTSSTASSTSTLVKQKQNDFNLKSWLMWLIPLLGLLVVGSLIFTMVRKSKHNKSDEDDFEDDGDNAHKKARKNCNNDSPVNNNNANASNKKKSNLIKDNKGQYCLLPGRRVCSPVKDY